MEQDTTIQVYDSQSAKYAHAFRVLLEHTDQKVVAGQWLTRFVEDLPRRRVFLDAGAGDGSLTVALARLFSRAIALEPNLRMREQLATRCEALEISDAKIPEASLTVEADFVLCSHVFYHIPQGAWEATLERLVSWLAVDGAAVVVLQNPRADGMRMMKDFFGVSYDLSPLTRGHRGPQCGRAYEITLETVPSEFVAPDFESAYEVAEFFLNDYPFGSQVPRRRDLEDYVRTHFRDARGYRISCDQDFLQVRRRS